MLQQGSVAKPGGGGLLFAAGYVWLWRGGRGWTSAGNFLQGAQRRLEGDRHRVADGFWVVCHWVTGALRRKDGKTFKRYRAKAGTRLQTLLVCITKWGCFKQQQISRNIQHLCYNEWGVKPNIEQNFKRNIPVKFELCYKRQDENSKDTHGTKCFKISFSNMRTTSLLSQRKTKTKSFSQVCFPQIWTFIYKNVFCFQRQSVQTKLQIKWKQNSHSHMGHPEVLEKSLLLW